MEVSEAGEVFGWVCIIMCINLDLWGLVRVCGLVRYVGERPSETGRVTSRTKFSSSGYGRTLLVLPNCFLF